MRDLPAKQKRPLQAFVAALSRNKERNYNCESVLCIPANGYIIASTDGKLRAKQMAGYRQKLLSTKKYRQNSCRYYSFRTLD